VLSSDNVYKRVSPMSPKGAGVNGPQQAADGAPYAAASPNAWSIIDQAHQDSSLPFS